ncbi:MAG: ABC transporter permease [Bacteroidales bacterium]|nr:ABC transporter permease [Bacteroidales bacterium]
MISFVANQLMKTNLFIARRYLFSKKSHAIINIISLISMVGVMISTAALIIVLSVYNGFEGLVLSLFNRFNPELLIVPAKGKTFLISDFPSEKVRALSAVEYIEPVLEENVLIRYKDKQSIVRIKGVQANYTAMNHLDTAIVQGNFLLEQELSNYAVLGYGVAYNLQANLNDFENPLQFYLPDKKKKLGAGFNTNFRTARLFPSGFFSVRQDYDEKYVFVPLSFARDLLDLPESVSRIEIGLFKGNEPETIKNELIKLLGQDYIVKTRGEQQSFLLKMMRSERWAIFLILGFILLIAAFNVIGSLSMLIIDKTKDIFTLHALGASRKFILSVFAWEGLLISLSGGLIGLIIGGSIAWIQQYFGLIGLGNGGNFVVDTYPVQIKALDFILVLAIVFSTSIFSVLYPLYQLSNKIKETRSNINAIKNVFHS